MTRTEHQDPVTSPVTVDRDAQGVGRGNCPPRTVRAAPRPQPGWRSSRGSRRGAHPIPERPPTPARWPRHRTRATEGWSRRRDPYLWLLTSRRARREGPPVGGGSGSGADRSERRSDHGAASILYRERSTWNGDRVGVHTAPQVLIGPVTPVYVLPEAHWRLTVPTSLMMIPAPDVPRGTAATPRISNHPDPGPDPIASERRSWRRLEGNRTAADVREPSTPCSTWNGDRRRLSGRSRACGASVTYANNGGRPEPLPCTRSALRHAWASARPVRARRRRPHGQASGGRRARRVSRRLRAT